MVSGSRTGCLGERLALVLLGAIPELHGDLEPRVVIRQCDVEEAAEQPARRGDAANEATLLCAEREGQQGASARARLA